MPRETVRIKTIPGPQGEPGRDGASGAPGKDGQSIVGPAGKDSTVPGPVGPASTVPGPQGAPGKDGKDSVVPGPTGPAGKDGKDGTNALPLFRPLRIPLGAISVLKQFPVTWATALDNTDYIVICGFESTSTVALGLGYHVLTNTKTASGCTILVTGSVSLSAAAYLTVFVVKL